MCSGPAACCLIVPCPLAPAFLFCSRTQARTAQEQLEEQEREAVALQATAASVAASMSAQQLVLQAHTLEMDGLQRRLRELLAAEELEEASAVQAQVTVRKGCGALPERALASARSSSPAQLIPCGVAPSAAGPARPHRQAAGRAGRA